MLFEKIQEGEFEFPEREWANISKEAKNLIRNMLVRDPRGRYSANDILTDPWVIEPVAATYLATPRVLSRNSSTQLLDTYAENAMAFNRMMLSQLAISESRTSSSSSEDTTENPFFSPRSLNSEQMFFIGSFSDDDLSAEDDDEEPSKLLESLSSSITLCPPNSKLAQRRRSRQRV